MPITIKSPITLALLFGTLGSLLFPSCLFSPSGKKGIPPVLWDTTFSIGSVHFPNDTVFNRANLSTTPNARMGKFLAKCATRDTVRIGYFGGSITMGAHATTVPRRFPNQLAAFIKSGFPHLKSVVVNNAGISGTGSRYGASRATVDVLSEAPDLIVIEYAVNDFVGGSDNEIRAAIEGLVRQCLFFAPDVPIMMLFTAKGDGQNVQNLHSEIGHHYGLPMISYRDAIWPLIDSGRIEWGDVFQDDPHPNDNGHYLAAYLMYTYLKRASGQTGGTGLTVPAPLYTDLYQYAGVTTTTDSTVRALLVGWNAQARDQNRIAYLTTGSGPSTLTLSTTWRELTLAIRMIPNDTSRVRVVLEGGGLDTVLHNFYPFEHTRLFKVFASDTSKLRTVRVEHSGTKLFTLDYVLYAGRPD